HRRDLPAAVVRGLEAFNPVDFVLPDETGASTPSPAAAPVPSSSVIQIASFRASEPVEAIAEAVPPIDLTPAPDGGYHIADVVARIDAFQR
ncbi:hypothetical protein, partial [Acinetobacter baumannii]